MYYNNHKTRKYNTFRDNYTNQMIDDVGAGGVSP